MPFFGMPPATRTPATMREVTCRVGDVLELDERTRLEVLGIGEGWTEVAVTVDSDEYGYGGSYDTFRLEREVRRTRSGGEMRRPADPFTRRSRA